MLDPEKYPGSLLGPATLDQRPYTDTADHLEGRPAWHAALARRICQGCPVRVQCLTRAVETGEAEGMRGGTTPGKRRRIRATRERRAAWPPARPWEELPPFTATRVK
ncbi:WhiB family transcriptional regulator [Nonomuraea bangladeshensis]|uniref:WhiB family transcriptional regulator n=1 Tax=Nonomuraea bangladeshensis TaxID=404385 RepID=A0ABV3H9X7_9ACTN